MITIYSKKRTDRNGKTFYIYLTKLKMAGDEQMVEVKFKGSSPKDFPINVDVDRKTSNLSKRKFVNRNGTEVMTNVLWIGEWTPSDDIYRDTSLDDVEL